jgi:uncharacterized RDD family membrane protein YckC
MSSKQPPEAPKPPSGFLSEEHKRRFTLTAGILGGVFFLAQFILPFVLMMAVMPAMMFAEGMRMSQAHPQRGALWKNGIWYIETSRSSAPATTSAPTLVTLPLKPDAQPTTVAELPSEDIWLLPEKDLLWLISSAEVFAYHGQELYAVTEGRPIGDITRPFIYEGFPAVIENSPAGLTLLVLVEGMWQERGTFNLPHQERICCIGSDLQVLSDGRRIYMFLKDGNTIFFREGPPAATDSGRDAWESVTQTRSSWNAFWLDGSPAVIYRMVTDEPAGIQGVRLVQGRWYHFFKYDRRPFGNIGVFPLEGSDSFMMLWQSFPGTLRLIEVDKGAVLQDLRIGEEFPFPFRMMPVMLVPHLMNFILPLVLAIILSRMMPKYRILDHRSDRRRMRFASLTRRAVAQLVDLVIIGSPFMVAGLIFMSAFFDFEAMMSSGPSAIKYGFKFFLGGFLWILICFCFYSVMEGVWGRTPGKWVAGIRVLGSDLKPCGVPRALVRNLLKVVDGFFNFLVGIMVAALSENWQRVGDMAARTVVVEAGGQSAQPSGTPRAITPA